MTPVEVSVTGIDLLSTLGPLAMLPGDPTLRLAPGRFERATITPDGPGVLVVTWAPGTDSARVHAHGDGARWLLDRAPRLLGCEDDVRSFSPATPPLSDLWRRHRGDRIAATGTLWHDLAWSILQQRINRLDAAAQWRRLVETLGTPMGDGLVAPPAPQVVGRLGYPTLHRFGIERRRAEHLQAAALAASRLQPLVDEPVDAVMPALTAVRGVGPWTASSVAAFTWGAPDTVILGDAGIPSMVTWLLAREPRGDDARMLQLLEPHRPHRYRVVRLAFAARSFPPKRAPRAPRTDIRRW